MSLHVRVRPSAKRDIARADAYYAQHARADAFIEALDHALEQIASRPLMYPVL
jgi:plasmid stabilization system protein ParE